MPTTVVVADAVGTYDQFLLVAGADKPTAVATNDADAGCIEKAGAGSIFRQTFTVAANVPGYIDQISTHRIGHVSRLSAGSDISGYFSLIVASTLYEQIYQSLNASYQTFTYDDLGGVPITGAQAAAAEIGIRTEQPGGSTLRCTYIYWSLTHSNKPQGFAWILSALPPMAAVVINEMPRLAMAAYRRTGTLIAPSEYDAALRELREWRRPTFFFPSRLALAT